MFVFDSVYVTMVYYPSPFLSKVMNLTFLHVVVSTSIFASVWWLSVPSDDYAVTYVVPEDGAQPDRWASDWLTVRVREAKDKSIHLFNGNVHIGRADDFGKFHRLLDIPLIATRPGVLVLKVEGAIFLHPSQCGYVWIKTDDLFHVLSLRGNKSCGNWYQKKIKLFTTLTGKFQLGDHFT